ncbi:hypothetical protein U1Q18_039006 [Sarracenia purpurea var. burkii]
MELPSPSTVNLVQTVARGSEAKDDISDRSGSIDSDNKDGTDLIHERETQGERRQIWRRGDGGRRSDGWSDRGGGKTRFRQQPIHPEMKVAREGASVVWCRRR